MHVSSHKLTDGKVHLILNVGRPKFYLHTSSVYKHNPICLDWGGGVFLLWSAQIDRKQSNHVLIFPHCFHTVSAYGVWYNVEKNQIALIADLFFYAAWLM